MFKKAGSFFESLLKKYPTSKPPPSPKVLRPALQPLSLPGILVEHSSSHSPVFIVKEKVSPLASSGFFSGLNYSQDTASLVLKVVPLLHIAVISPLLALGYGNPGYASLVYSQGATVGPVGFHPTRGSSPHAGSLSACGFPLALLHPYQLVLIPVLLLLLLLAPVLVLLLLLLFLVLILTLVLAPVYHFLALALIFLVLVLLFLVLGV